MVVVWAESVQRKDVIVSIEKECKVNPELIEQEYCVLYDPSKSKKYQYII